jgi:hypothetical protein
MPDAETLLRELNHRVKGNFQIIASLMNLRKRTLPVERHDDIRFIEEHVQAMSAPYRLVYASGTIIDVPLSHLINDVLSALRQISSLGEEKLRVETAVNYASLSLDRAIPLALYLAALIPPYLDAALATTGFVTVSVGMVATLVTLTVRGSWNEPIALDQLRGRLMQAYAGQLGAEISPAMGLGGKQIRFPLAVSV